MKDVILIVDDEPMLRELLADFLRYKGFKTIEAEDGPAALKLIEEKSDIGLVMSDVLMPGMNGFELCEKIKQRSPEIPFVIVTGNGYPYEKHGKKSSVDAMISKPFDYATIQVLIKGFLPG